MYKEAFASRLKYARETAEMSQREVARTIGISQAMICQYETGKSEPPIEMIGKLANLYGVSVNFLFSTEDI